MGTSTGNINVKKPSSFRLFCWVLICISTCSCVWQEPEDDPSYLPLDDTEYPYAGIPRFVIETNSFAEINNKTNYIPAYLQIYEKDAPLGEPVKLAIKGKGSSSFTMPKFSYKLEFEEKQSFFNMPENRDWDLISNFRDKTFLKNYLTYQLAGTLQDEYTPRCDFVELYINRTYLGLYLLAEHVKVGKNRVNINKTDSSFLIEKTRIKNGETLPQNSFYSDRERLYEIRYPKSPSTEDSTFIRNTVDKFESQLKDTSTNLYSILDMTDFVRYYWIQEFSKNIDGAFGRSIFITWEPKNNFRMGPVWDFDLGYGNDNKKKSSPYDWYVRYQGWFKDLFQHKSFKQEAAKYWKENQHYFLGIIDSIPRIQKQIQKAAENDEKKWPVLENDTDWPFVDSYSSYEDAIDSLKYWIKTRAEWISGHI